MRESPDEDTADKDTAAGDGAPWDPCRIITWDDLPGEKPGDETRATPQPQPADPNAAFTAACRFVALSNDVGVLWGPSSRATVAPSGQPGEQQITVAGRPGLQIVSLSDALTLVCMVKVDLGDGRGVAGVGALARNKDPAPDKHPCSIAVTLMADIVERTR